jgi:FtsX-like permease family
LEVIAGMSRALRVARYRFRTNFHRRWPGYLSVIVLIGSVGGLALASVAGARRTESSFPTYVASVNPSTVLILSRYDDPELHVNSGYSARLAKEFAHLAFVRRATTAIIFDGNISLPAIKGLHSHVLAGESPPTFVGSWDGEFSAVDRATLLTGRLANPRLLNEAVMNVQAASEMGLHVGSVIQIPFYTDAQTRNATSGANLPKPFRVVRVKMVGEVFPAGPVVQSDIDTLGSAEVIFSPALSRELAPKCSTGTETSLQLIGGDRNAKRVLAEVNRIDPDAANFGEQVTSTNLPAVQQAIEPEAIALAVFGGIAGLTVLLIAALMIGRIIRDGAEETAALRALGADRSMMLGDHLAGVLGAVFVGAILAVAIAIGLSPLAPLGPVRPVYPNPGVAFDWTVLGFGFLAMIAVLGSLAIVFTSRAVGRSRSRGPSRAGKSESPLVRSATNSGLPISAAVGVRFALEPGRGRTAAPVRSAILGAVLAVTVLVTTVTFGASFDSLVSRPALYGWNWNYAILSSFAGAEALPNHQIAALLNKDPDIQTWSGVYFTEAKLDRDPVAMLAERPGARVAPPLLSGHGLDAVNQIVLGSATLARLHKRVGDTVAFNDGLSKPTKLLIVGTATMPALSDGVGMGMGALASTSDFPASLLNIQDSPIPGPDAVLVRVRAGVKPSMAYRSLEKVNREVNAIPEASGLAGGVITVLRPVEIVNFHSIGTTPTIFAASLAVGAVAALGITIGASVRRRRRDLALLKAIGFTQGQLASAIAWQSTVAAVIGAIVGIPLGVIIGRQLWILFADSIGAVPDPTVPILSLTLIGVGALVFAIVVAAIPGRIAARTPTALVLRAE